MCHQAPRAHLSRARLVWLLAAFIAALCFGTVATSEASAATGSYNLTSFQTPTLYNEDTLTDGQTISPPAGVPSTALITSVTISLDWVPKPNPPGYYSSSTNYVVYICEGPFGTPDTACANVSPTYSGQSGWTVTTTAFASSNLNASTQQFHIVAALSDGNLGGSYKLAINPPRYVDSKSLTVNYTY